MKASLSFILNKNKNVYHRYRYDTFSFLRFINSTSSLGHTRQIYFYFYFAERAMLNVTCDIIMMFFFYFFFGNFFDITHQAKIMLISSLIDTDFALLNSERCVNIFKKCILKIFNFFHRIFNDLYGLPIIINICL